MINEQQPDFAHTPANPLSKGFDYTLADKSASPVITIVTPFYNTGEVFHETARCILGQSLQQWEWIIVNDGTTDTTAETILAEYRNKDARIRVIDHPQNRGLSAARNTGFNHARCEYVLIVDSDDLLEPCAAEKWWWYLLTHPQAGFVASYHVAYGGKNYLWTGGFHDSALNAQRNQVSMLCMIRKSVYTLVGGFDESIRGGLEDWDFWMRCAAQGIWGATIPEFLAWYRVRGEHSDRWQNLTEQRIKEFRTMFQSKYPHLYSGGFPQLIDKVDLDLTEISLDQIQANRLEKTGPHLLLVLPWLAMGGAERFALNLIDQLIVRGWKVSIVITSPSENAWKNEFEKRTQDIFILPNFLPIKDYPRFIGSLIYSRGIDALMVQGSLEGYRLLPAIRALYPEILIFDYLHFVTPDWMDGGLPRLSGLYRDSIDITITSCEQVKRWMVAEGGEEARLSVCPIGVDAICWKPDPIARARVRGELHIHPDEVVLIYAARIEAQKQPQVFAETLRLLHEQGLPFRALVAGDGSLRPELEQKIARDGLNEKVAFLGAVKSEDMPALLAAGDIFFLPSLNEGISSAVYEAMSSGMAVVGADVGGQAELVTPECGILIAPRPEGELAPAYASALHVLMEDSPRRQRMGTASRERIMRGYTLDHMGAQMERIIAEAKQRKAKGHLRPVVFSPEQRLIRDTQHVVEYLQARQEWRNLNERHVDIAQKYFELIQPKRPSYWFYLWLRQLFLPAQTGIQNSKLHPAFEAVRKWLKRTLIKK